MNAQTHLPSWADFCIIIVTLFSHIPCLACTEKTRDNARRGIVNDYLLCCISTIVGGIFFSSLCALCRPLKKPPKVKQKDERLVLMICYNALKRNK
ncbi:hypothetical protein BKA57DRAFT_148436 [Linnemannia elongata]|nr:hypothetical protein BKA57DRAFT_148436 [Linnemannia elongata]